MSAMAKQARADMRAKIKRITTADPHQKVDASSWSPPEPLNAGRKIYDQSKLKNATARIYKLGGRVQGDRGPVRRDKAPRTHRDSGGGVPTSRLQENPTTGSKIPGITMNKGGSAYATGCESMRRGGKTGDGFYEGTRPTGGRIARASGGKTKTKEYCPHCDAAYPDEDSLKCVACGKNRGANYNESNINDERKGRASGGPANPRYNREAVDKEIRKDKRIGGKEAAAIHRVLRGRTSPREMQRQVMDEGPYQGGDDELKRGGRAKRAHGGKAKGKTTIHINIGKDGAQQGPAPMMPPVQQVTRPPAMPPPMPMPPPGGPPPGAGGPPGGPGGPPIPPASMGGPPPGMPRRRGGRTSMPHMSAGSGSGEGRLEKSRLQAHSNK